MRYLSITTETLELSLPKTRSDTFWHQCNIVTSLLSDPTDLVLCLMSLIRKWFEPDSILSTDSLEWMRTQSRLV